MRRIVLPVVLLVVMLLISIPVAARQAVDEQEHAEENTAAITSAVTEFLTQQASNYPGSVQVGVDTPRPEPHASCNDLQVFLPGGQRLRSRMSIGIRCLSPSSWTARVQATLAIHGFFYVTNRTLEPGETVSLDHLIAREGDILSLGRGTIVDPSQIIDHIVTQRIPAGTPLKARALRSPMSVQRGQTVITEARGTGFVATGEARALQDGAPGEQIRVRTGSGQIITATVRDAHTVQVMM